MKFPYNINILNLIFILHGIIILMLSVPASQAADETGFVYPEENSAVTTGMIRLIGTAAPEISSVNLEIQNKIPERFTIAVANNTFSQLLELQPGLNTIVLQDSQGATLDRLRLFYAAAGDSTRPPSQYVPYYLHSKTELTGKCRGCHRISSRDTANFSYIDQQQSCLTDSCHEDIGKARFIHGPVKEGFCVGCHNPHGSGNKNFLSSLREDLCNSCHTTMEEITPNMVVHFPVAKGECTSCHDPHQSNLEFHLKRNSVVELCAGCHGYNMQQEEFMHEPVKSGDCIACHTPHTSPVKGLLYKKGTELCIMCHEIRKEEFQAKYVHAPVEKNCSLCHDPHGSQAIFHLKTPKNKKGHYLKVNQPVKELCLICHEKLDPTIALSIKSSKVTHQPVHDGKCTVCHTPHSTNYQKQLNAPLQKICFSCHTAMKEHITKSRYKHGPVIKNQCSQCHMVHGSDRKFLLAAEFSQKFYSSFQVENYTLCFNCHNMQVVLQERSLETGFRNGDRNLHFEHVNRKKNGRNCKTCHDIHASNQPKHIREKIPYKKKFNISLQYSKTASGGGCIVGCHKPRDYDRINPVKYKEGLKP